MRLYIRDANPGRRIYGDCVEISLRKKLVKLESILELNIKNDEALRLKAQPTQPVFLAEFKPTSRFVDGTSDGLTNRWPRRYGFFWDGGHMARKRGSNGFSALAALPWPIGFASGIAGYFTVRYGLTWWLSQGGGTLAQGIAQHPDSLFAPLAWMVLAICWMAAFFSFLGARHRRRLLDTRTTLESLAAGGWRQFELLVGEAFRRQAYTVEETGLGGADGGIDLILRKDGRRTLVQCKQWKRQQVGVSVVREMYGLLAHHQAHAVKIVCIGSYTKDAALFAHGKPIELISGERLLEMIQAAQRGGAASFPIKPRIEPALVPAVNSVVQTPACRRCGSKLVQRSNRRTGEVFLGCSQFPRCRGTG